MAHSTKQRALEVSTTAESVFGDGTFSSARRLPIQEDVTIDPADERLATDFRAYRLERWMPQVGAQRPTFPIKLPVFGSGTIANASTVAGTSFLHELLLMSGCQLVDGGTAKAGATITDYTAGDSNTPDTIEVATGQGARFAAGSAFYTQTGEIGWVKSVSGDVLTLARNLANDPTTGDTDVLYAMRTYYPRRTAAAELPTYAMKLYNTHKEFLIKGCAVSALKLAAQPGKALDLSMTVIGNDLTLDSPTTPSDPATWLSFLKAFGSARCDLYINGEGWISPRYSSLEFDLGAKVQDVPDITGAQGRGAFAVTDFMPTFAAENVFDDGSGGNLIRLSTDEFSMMASWSNGQGNKVAIYMPCCEINGVPGDSSDLRTAKYTAGAVHGNLSFGPGQVYIAIA